MKNQQWINKNRTDHSNDQKWLANLYLRVGRPDLRSASSNKPSLGRWAAVILSVYSGERLLWLQQQPVFAARAEQQRTIRRKLPVANCSEADDWSEDC